MAETIPDDILMPRVWLTILTLAFASSVLSAQRPLFTRGIDLVHVGVSIVDDNGEPVGDLSPDDLEVYEDGELQEIRYCSRGLSTDTDRLPTHLGVLLDASASMGEDERLAKTAAIRFLNTLTYAADITLVDFDDTVRVGRYAQRDFPRLVERIRNRKAGGMTAFYDALGATSTARSTRTGAKCLDVL